MNDTTEELRLNCGVYRRAYLPEGVEAADQLPLPLPSARRWSPPRAVSALLPPDDAFAALAGAEPLAEAGALLEEEGPLLMLVLLLLVFFVVFLADFGVGPMRRPL